MSGPRLFAPALSRRALAAAGAAGAAGLALAGWGLWRRLSEPATYDVVVIGSGAAGLSAAVAAAEAGASVLVIEKQSEIGGNTLISGGYFAAVDPKRQKAQQIDDSEALFLKQMLESGGALAEPRLARTLVDGAGAALRWLESLGMRFQPGVIEIYGAHWPRCHKPMMPGGQGYIYALSAAAAKLGVTIAAHMKAERLEPLGSKGAPRGSGGWRIRCAGPEGEAVVFEARRGLVLASGGFGASRSMIEAFSPKLAGLTTDNTPGSTGEMLLEAARCGAALAGMEAVQCLPGCPPGRTHRVRLHNDVSRFIFVDGRGRRFIREDERRDVLRDAVLALPEGFAYTIVDDAGLRSYNILVQKEAVIGIETGDAWRGAPSRSSLQPAKRQAACMAPTAWVQTASMTPSSSAGSPDEAPQLVRSHPDGSAAVRAALRDPLSGASAACKIVEIPPKAPQTAPYSLKQAPDCRRKAADCQ